VAQKMRVKYSHIQSVETIFDFQASWVRKTGSLLTM
jgi:hypothetical protein